MHHYIIQLYSTLQQLYGCTLLYDYPYNIITENRRQITFCKNIKLEGTSSSDNTNNKNSNITQY